LIRYILKRLLQFIPSFIVITFLGFLLNDYAPIDPAERYALRGMEGGKPLAAQQHDAILLAERHRLGLDLPMFYFSVNANYECDTLERIPNRKEREALKKLTAEYKNWPAVANYYLNVKELSAFFQQFHEHASWVDHLTNRVTNSPEGVISEPINIVVFKNVGLIEEHVNQLLILTDISKIKSQLNLIDSLAFNTPFYNRINKLKDAFYSLKYSTSSITYPTLSFHTNNRYHRWLFGDGESSLGILRGDFGTSYQSGQKVGKIIASHIGYTLAFSLGGILLAYLISIPLGVYSAVNRNTWFDRVSTVVLFLLYSFPSFWLATLLLMAFANPDTLYWFEASGIKPAQGYPAGANIFQKLSISLPYIILPLVCYTYASLAFLSRTLRVSVLENIKHDYITTARAKGLPQRSVIWRHAFRNSLLPLITVLANVFPYAIGGSVILETIFTLPGMGFETYRAILGQDYPIIMAMLTLTAVLTIVGLLVQDVLYALADPRINFNKKS
jgi:peptide/nickel transport system permease protein